MTPLILQNSGSLGCKDKARQMDCTGLTGHRTELLRFGTII